jgi:hypothetical protein
MMYADDEKHLTDAQAEINSLIDRRVSALEERVMKVEITQAEDHEEIVGMRHDLRFVRDYVMEDQRGWRWFQTTLVIVGVGFWIGLIWFLV